MPTSLPGSSGNEVGKMLPTMPRIHHQNQLIVKVWEKAVQKLSNPPTPWGIRTDYILIKSSATLRRSSKVVVPVKTDFVTNNHAIKQVLTTCWRNIFFSIVEVLSVHIWCSHVCGLCKYKLNMQGTVGWERLNMGLDIRELGFYQWGCLPQTELDNSGMIKILMKLKIINYFRTMTQNTSS